MLLESVSDEKDRSIYFKLLAKRSHHGIECACNLPDQKAPLFHRPQRFHSLLRLQDLDQSIVEIAPPELLILKIKETLFQIMFMI